MPGEMLSFNVADASREYSSFGIRVGAVTAVSLPGLLTQVGTLRAATEGVILGVIQNEQLVAFKSPLSTAFPADANAQRERKWLVTYVDDTRFFDDPINSIPNEGFGKKFQVELPTASFAGDLLTTGTDNANLESAAWIAWIAAFEAIGRSPHGGVPSVIDIRSVGRNI